MELIFENDIIDIMMEGDKDEAKELLFNNAIWLSEYLYYAYKDKDYKRMLNIIFNRIDEKEVDIQKKYAENVLTCDEEKIEKMILSAGRVFDVKVYNNLQELIEGVQKHKKELYSTYLLKWNKKNKTEKLNKAYFYKLIEDSENRSELLDACIIKLTQKLEAVLKSDYNFDGQLNEMIDKLAKTKDIYYNKINMCYLLHKLRKYSNDTRHFDSNSDEININELKKCIDYICYLDKDTKED